jgi:hypothetical protein
MGKPKTPAVLTYKEMWRVKKEDRNTPLEVFNMSGSSRKIYRYLRSRFPLPLDECWVVGKVKEETSSEEDIYVLEDQQ